MVTLKYSFNKRERERESRLWLSTNKTMQSFYTENKVCWINLGCEIEMYIEQGRS